MSNINNKAAVMRSPLTEHRSFAFLWLNRLLSTSAYQMLTVVIGWQIYELTGSAFDLGIVGLLQFIPAVLLTLPIGHMADRYDRRLLLRGAQIVLLLCALSLLVGFAMRGLTRDVLFIAVFVIGCCRAFEIPTGHALVPALVPTAILPRATAAWAASNQTATICGPALGGLLYSVSPLFACAACVVLFATAATMIGWLKLERTPGTREPPTLASVLAGFHFIRQRPRLLGVVTLDLFVVLLGGATALLPVFARDILHVGPLGLGLLRSAPAVGALLTMLVMTRYPIERRIGPALFIAVAIFGLATTVFGLSTWFPLSLAALAVLGASDAVSVVLRFTLVQIETPDHMRGRVSAINFLFTGTSNTLGEFESGTVAAWLGTVPSVVIGGLGSMLIALIWIGAFPDLRRADRYKLPDEANSGQTSGADADLRRRP